MNPNEPNLPANANGDESIEEKPVSGGAHPSFQADAGYAMLPAVDVPTLDQIQSIRRRRRTRVAGASVAFGAAVVMLVFAFTKPSERDNRLPGADDNKSNVAFRTPDSDDPPSRKEGPDNEETPFSPPVAEDLLVKPRLASHQVHVLWSALVPLIELDEQEEPRIVGWEVQEFKTPLDPNHLAADQRVLLQQVYEQSASEPVIEL